ncbi:hypothetical protein EW026_g1174 [Hermanssonia centrifuga]|uniref:Uncharacterized protein n=1 Tax=Hermanssonia centrifuga TaxID=98765 RepID=A0A4S4KT02_9APHY|nr:hypothetical protein EW026_g1174 [Hermanssonia centrifuga]
MTFTADEIVQIILNELDDPTNFSLASKRFYAFTQDPYIRACYFLSRYGRIQALYWALGRGRLMNEKVIDTLLSSGAHLSRYLVQCAMHHFYRTAQVPFIKTPWVRSMDLRVFTYFQKIAVDLYGNVPLGKGDDDGSLFESIIKESRFPIEQRSIKWETLRDILEKFKFIPFCHKDAMMANFPLALAIEPRLLPYARENGFHMDHKYRNFVFRKMFEKPAIAFEGRTDEIVRNVQELCRLDPHMFISRTVAAEICMELKTNDAAYNALKRLDKEGLLRGKIESIGLHPIKRADLLEVLASRFAPERLNGVLEYGRSILGLSRNEIEGVLQELAFRCLEIGCKGKLLKKLVELYPFLADAIRERVLKKYKIDLDDLPPWQDEVACSMFEAPLCQDFMVPKMSYFEDSRSTPVTRENGPVIQAQSAVGVEERQATGHVEALATKPAAEDGDDLGHIGQDTLSTMIRKDELAPARGRRRFYDAYASYHDTQGKLTYPADNLAVGRWVRMHFGARSPVTAIFMMHAILNGNSTVMQPFLQYTETHDPANRIPLTLKHFKLLARLGRALAPALFDDIEAGIEFYFGEEDYLTLEELNGNCPRSSSRKRHARIRIKMVTEYTVKTESSPTPPTTQLGSSSAVTAANLPAVTKGKKRPRRSATSSTKSYIVPDSDDEMIADDADVVMHEVHAIAKRRKVESNLQKWIKHLSVLLKEEQKKCKEIKKLAHAACASGTKVRVPKTEFHRSLSQALVRLRKADREKRQQLYGADFPLEDYSSGEEDEYHERTTRPLKRRKNEQPS